MGAAVQTYVRNDNSDETYQVYSVNTATNGKRLNGLIESKREEIEKNSWLVVGDIPVDINTSDGLAKSLSSANLIDLLSGNTFRIATEEGEKE